MTDDAKDNAEGIFRVACACPVCFAKLDGASTNPKDKDMRAPISGDLTVCLYCGVALEWNDAMELVRLSKDTYDGLGDRQRAEITRLGLAIRLHLKGLAKKRGRDDS